MDIPYGHYARILHGCIDGAMNSALEEMELTAAQGRVMGYLSRQQAPPCPRDLEEAFHLSHPTVSGLLSRLEQKGFLQLRTDLEDRRCKRIYILPKGVQCHERMHSTICQIEDQIVLDFTPEEQQQFAALLQRAIHNLGGNPHYQKYKEDPNE